MKRYRSRPSTCEAEQWFPGRNVEGVRYETPEEATATIGGRGYGAIVCPQPPKPYVITIHGQRAFLDPGDWVVREPTDPTRHYPVKADVFERRWEDDEPPPKADEWSKPDYGL